MYSKLELVTEPSQLEPSQVKVSYGAQLAVTEPSQLVTEPRVSYGAQSQLELVTEPSQSVTEPR